MYTYANIAVPAKICILSCNSLSNYLVIYINSDPDVGSFISNIQVKAVNWNKLQPDGTVAPANGG